MSFFVFATCLLRVCYVFVVFNICSLRYVFAVCVRCTECVHCVCSLWSIEQSLCYCVTKYLTIKWGDVPKNRFANRLLDDKFWQDFRILPC